MALETEAGSRERGERGKKGDDPRRMRTAGGWSPQSRSDLPTAASSRQRHDRARRDQAAQRRAFKRRGRTVLVGEVVQEDRVVFPRHVRPGPVGSQQPEAPLLPLPQLMMPRLRI